MCGAVAALEREGGSAATCLITGPLAEPQAGVGALSRPGRWQVSWGLRARRCAFLPNTPGKLRPALRQAVPVVGWLWLAFRFSSSGLAKRYPRAGSVCSVGGRGEAPFGRACRGESFGSGPHATQKGGRILFPSEQGSDATATLQQCPCCGYFVFFPGSASKIKLSTRSRLASPPVSKNVDGVKACYLGLPGPELK